MDIRQKNRELICGIHSCVQKEIIYLKIIRNFTFKEISQILGKNEEWARTKFYRGKLKLKESLKDEK